MNNTWPGSGAPPRVVHGRTRIVADPDSCVRRSLVRRHSYSNSVVDDAFATPSMIRPVVTGISRRHDAELLVLGFGRSRRFSSSIPLTRTSGRYECGRDTGALGRRRPAPGSRLRRFPHVTARVPSVQRSRPQPARGSPRGPSFAPLSPGDFSYRDLDRIHISGRTPMTTRANTYYCGRRSSIVWCRWRASLCCCG